MEQETLACSIDGCTASFPNGEEYTAHMAETHRQLSYKERSESVSQYNPESVTAQQDGNAAETSETLQCLEAGCNAPTYHSAEGLAYHKQVCHRVANPFRCKVGWCGKAFQTNDLMQEHLKLKHPRTYAAEHTVKGVPHPFASDVNGKPVYKCQEPGCEKAKNGYTGYRGLEFHMWAVHDTLFEKFKCPEQSCEQYFPGNRELKCHQGHVHGLWRCTVARCLFQTSSIDDLESHVQERRHGEGPKTSKTFQYLVKGKTSIVVDTPGYIPEKSSKLRGLGPLGLNEDLALGKFLGCPASTPCDFRHAHEWGIKEHWKVAHEDGDYPGVDQSHPGSRGRTLDISQPLRSRQLSEPRGDLDTQIRRSRAVTVGPSSSRPRDVFMHVQKVKCPTPINKSLVRVNPQQMPHLGEQFQGPFTHPFANHTMQNSHATTPLGAPFGVADSDAVSKNRRLGARSIAQLDIFNPGHGKDPRALKPTYRAPLPGAVKKEKVVDPEEDTKDPLRISPTTPALRRLMERIQADVEKGRKIRKPKAHPDESDSDMSDIEDNPMASNFPRYGNPRPGYWIDDRVVMNYPEPPPKKKKKSGAAIEEEISQPNLDKYGGYPEPLKVSMNFYCNPKTLPISKIERARIEQNDPDKIAKPGPPPVLPEAAGFAFGGSAKKLRRATCTGPPRLKRKYQWKGGVAPKRRLGHVKRDEVEEESEEEDDESDSEEDWGDDSDSVLGDDSDNESVAEDVLMKGA